MIFWIGSIASFIVIAYLIIVLVALAVIKYAIVPTFLADIEPQSDLYRALKH